ncbi:hypothetical protein [Micromonospora aurantiaca (nom. illeg.)]|uniref:hypothetical protein n=1 Tax=Micromonospora aurantiaca (nom. illeg.) TaxID=47850 RepID=UPI0033EBD4F8
MGTGGKTAHQSYIVAPTEAGGLPTDQAAVPQPADPEQVTPAPPTPEPETPPKPAAVPAEPEPAPAAASAAATGGGEGAAGGGLPAADLHGQPLIDAYQALTAADPASVQPWLSGLTADQLQELATAHGFQHPEMVGLSGKQPHPLVHWLDPKYPADIASKQKIQAVANSRYAAFAAEDAMLDLSVPGTAAPVPQPNPHASWIATPAEVVDAQLAVANAGLDLLNLTPKGYGAAQKTEERAAALAQLIAAENRLATAVCPEDPQLLASGQAKSSQHVDQILSKLLNNPQLVAQVRADAAASGLLTEAQSGVLTPAGVVRVARLATPAAARQEALDVAESRLGQLQQLADLDGTLVSKVGNTTNVWGSWGDDAGGLAEIAAIKGKMAQLNKDVYGWKSKVCDNPAEAPGVYWQAPWVGELSTQFRAWAKKQPIGQVREAAAQLGLADSGKATRAQAQNFIAAQWDPACDKAAIQTEVSAGKAKTAAATTTTGAAQPPQPAKPAATAPPAAVVSAPSAAPQPGSWKAAQHNLVSALKHAAASSSGLPGWVDAQAVKNWDFGTGTSASGLGGTHHKSFHQGPDGGTWLFKTDATGGGQAAAESAAARILHAAGQPTVPVYRATLGGKTGSIQPMLPGAVTFEGHPGQWSQADADAIVRYHVAAWVVGNHDGHANNLLRTPSGGMVPIDLGQAYKFCDVDKLSLAYNPVAETVHHKLYQAHQSGGLSSGVKVNPAAAHPVLRAIEKIPDSQWRAMLHDVAHTGAATNRRWVPTMRARAAKTHGIAESAVTTHQVADAFLDAAVSRKNSLREGFAAFFAGELKLPSAAALLHGKDR